MNGQIELLHNLIPAVKEDFHPRYHPLIEVFGIDAVIYAIDEHSQAVIHTAKGMSLELPKIMPTKWLRRAVKRCIDSGMNLKMTAEYLGYNYRWVCGIARSFKKDMVEV